MQHIVRVPKLWNRSGEDILLLQGSWSYSGQQNPTVLQAIFSEAYSASKRNDNASLNGVVEDPE
jgi:hypothetical protein